jgi:hypothetical protein
MTSVILGGCAVLMVLVMLHHPVHGDGSDPGAVLGPLGRPGAVVHGTLIALLLVLVVALQRAADTLRAIGIDTRAGGLALAVSAAGYTVAASINGFIFPDIASEAGSMAEAQRAALPLIAAALRHVAGFCAVLASGAMGAALLSWSAPMLVRRGATRALGALGVLVGSAVILAMLTGSLRLDVPGMTRVVAVFSLWFLCLAVWLWERPPAAA